VDDDDDDDDDHDDHDDDDDGGGDTGSGGGHSRVPVAHRTRDESPLVRSASHGSALCQLFAECSTRGEICECPSNVVGTGGGEGDIRETSAWIERFSLGQHEISVGALVSSRALHASFESDHAR